MRAADPATLGPAIRRCQGCPGRTPLRQFGNDWLLPLTTALGLWDDPVVASAMAESDFDLGALRCERMSVFVCGGPADIRIYRLVYGLLFQQLVQMNTRVEFGRDPRHRHRVLGVHDEFWALGKQDVLADASAFTASYGFRWCYVQQSEERIVATFGAEGAKNLFTNTGARLHFGGMDRDAAEKISKWTGDNTVKASSRNRPRFMPWFKPHKATESERECPRPLVLPQGIQRLPRHKLLVRRGDLHLFKLDRVRWHDGARWHDDPWFRHMAAPAPDVPALAVTVEREDLAALAARRREAAERARAAAQEKEMAGELQAEAERAEAGRRLAALREQEREASAAEADAAAEERYIESYWSRISGLWVQGDFASVDEDGTWFIHGRSDDTLKIAGKRTGPAEIEALLLATGKAAEAAAIGVPDPVKGSAVVCVCVPARGVAATPEVVEELKRAVAAGLGTSFRPKAVVFVEDLPKTRSMKIMRRVVRAVWVGDPVGDLSGLVNPEAVARLRACVAHEEPA